VERSNSSLRFVKSGFSSTMRENRLNALLLLFIPQDIALDYDAIIIRLCQAQPEKDGIYQSPAMNAYISFVHFVCSVSEAYICSRK